MIEPITFRGVPLRAMSLGRATGWSCFAKKVPQKSSKLEVLFGWGKNKLKQKEQKKLQGTIVEKF